MVSLSSRAWTGLPIGTTVVSVGAVVVLRLFLPEVGV